MGLLTPNRGLLAARELPDGSFEYLENRSIIERLREGDATVGWAGDPTATLVRNNVADRWEVWGKRADGTHGMLMHLPGHASRLPGVAMLRALAEHDTHHVDVLARVEKQNAAADRAQKAEFDAATEAAGDKLAHALAKDLGLPAPDGRLYPLSSP